MMMMMVKDHNCRVLQPNLSQSSGHARMSGEVANQFESLGRALCSVGAYLVNHELFVRHAEIAIN
jgi:hypothetical protein